MHGVVDLTRASWYKNGFKSVRYLDFPLPQNKMSLKKLWNSELEKERFINDDRIEEFDERDEEDTEEFNKSMEEWASELVTIKNNSLKQTPERRKEIADFMFFITLEEARNDLMTNKDSPFLFRKWLKQIQDSGPEYIKNPPVDDPYPHQTEKLIEDYIGKHVIKLLGCSCGNNASYRIHPKYEWNYDSGQWNIKALKGPCSYWSGHIGYCWEGTMSRENLTYAH